MLLQISRERASWLSKDKTLVQDDYSETQVSFHPYHTKYEARTACYTHDG